MAIYDRWHLSHPTDDATPCRCGRGKHKLYPSADHPGRLNKRGKRLPDLPRWQVRYRDDNDNQLKRNFAERDGDDPEQHASAFDAKVNHDLDAGSYVAPERARQTLKAFGEAWRTSLVANPSSLENYDRKLTHIYGDNSLLASRTLLALAQQPGIIQAWIKELEGKGLGANYILQIVDMLSSIFVAAIDNGMPIRNPTKVKSLRLPTPTKTIITPWTQAMVEAAREKLGERGLEEMVDLGVGGGLRQGEIFGVGSDDFDGQTLQVRRQVKWFSEQEGQPSGLAFAPPKYNKEREVPLSTAVAERLQVRLEKTPPVKVTLPWGSPTSRKLMTVPMLFVRPRGLPYHRQCFGYIWRDARDAMRRRAHSGERDAHPAAHLRLGDVGRAGGHPEARRLAGACRSGFHDA